jgi:hypothetical protein
VTGSPSGGGRSFLVQKYPGLLIHLECRVWWELTELIVYSKYMNRYSKQENHKVNLDNIVYVVAFEEQGHLKTIA